jgi:hypothetical protein
MKKEKSKSKKHEENQISELEEFIEIKEIKKPEEKPEIKEVVEHDSKEFLIADSITSAPVLEQIEEIPKIKDLEQDLSQIDISQEKKDEEEVGYERTVKYDQKKYQERTESYLTSQSLGREYTVDQSTEKREGEQQFAPEIIHGHYVGKSKEKNPLLKEEVYQTYKI